MGTWVRLAILVVLPTREIASAMAVGAQNRDVLGLVCAKHAPVALWIDCGMFSLLDLLSLRGILLDPHRRWRLLRIGVSFLFLTIALLAAYPTPPGEPCASIPFWLSDTNENWFVPEPHRPSFRINRQSKAAPTRDQIGLTPVLAERSPPHCRQSTTVRQPKTPRRKQNAIAGSVRTHARVYLGV